LKVSEALDAPSQSEFLTASISALMQSEWDAIPSYRNASLLSGIVCITRGWRRVALALFAVHLA
jgi:hypothetical protein